MRDTFKVAAAFGIGLIVASGATLAQSYGRGRNVQFVDGATISPTNVTASGTADQFVCTSTTATCEVESSASATTMTSTVPAFDIGPTATPGANDRLACFSYGATGSKTRVACVDAEGDVATTGSFNSSVASGNQAYTCSNVGCRLSLGSTARYLVDDGTNLEFVAPLQATSFEATTASGSSLTGGGASGALEITSNTPDSFTSGTVPAIRLKASQNITDTDLLMSVEDSAGNRRVTINEVGSSYFAGLMQVDNVIQSASNVQSQTGLFVGVNNTASLNSNVGSTTSSIRLRSSVNKTGDTTRLVEIVNNSTTEVAHFSKDGLLRVNSANAAKPTCNADNRGRTYYLDGASGVADTYEICAKNTADAYAWVQASLASDNTSAPMELLSNTPDSATSGTVPAIRLKASQNITDADLLMSVEDSAGNRRLSLTEAGSLDVATDINDARDVYVTRYFFSNGETIVNGALRRTSSSVTIADNGGGTPATHTQAYLSTVASFVRYTCNDADGCAVTMSETAVEHGHVLMFANTSANNVTFADISGVQEMAGGVTATLGQYDTLQLVYTGDRWAELHRSDN